MLILVPLAPICTEAGLGPVQFSAQRYIPIFLTFQGGSHSILEIRIIKYLNIY